MDQSVYILIQKLSTAVEDLPIDKRACHQLKHANLHTVAEVILAGKPALMSAKNIGPLSADRIWKAVANYAGLPEEALGNAGPSQGDDPLDAREASIAFLPLTQTTLFALRCMGVSRIQQLIQARAASYNTFIGISGEEIGRIDRALRRYLVSAAQDLFSDPGGQPAVAAPEAPEPEETIPVPDMALPLPKLSTCDWSLLEHRAMQLSSMEEIAVKFELSKRTVRRTIDQAHDQLQRKMVFLSLFLDQFEKKSNSLHNELGNGPLDLKTLSLHLLSEPVLPDLAVEEWQAERLILLVRSMVLQPSSWFRAHMEPRWPSFILSSCLVEPAIVKHTQVRRLLRARKLEGKNMAYWELAYRILVQSGKPMHVSTIAEEARQLGGRDSLKLGALQNMLSARKDLFLRVGPGAYALAEWGGQTPEYYPAIIASILSGADRPMPLDWIQDRVSAIRPIKPSSLRMILNLHIRFYKSIQNTYGLRVWLPIEREAQEIPLPDWLVEAPESLKRVERARAKGFHVEKILAQDMLQQESGEAVV
jgi:hypothetical protein